MNIAAEDIAKIEDIVERIVEERLKPRPVSVSAYDIELRERMLRVEEELKHQRELMMEGFKQIDKRFEQVDKRFESIQMQMDRRFEQVDKRFEQQHQEIMAIHSEIKLLMRWGFGALIAVGGLFATVLRLLA
jgi:ABC-type Na+ transport system ATPase subunit NatA